MGWRSGLAGALALLCLGLLAPVASAVEFPYTLDPELSLTGDCSTSAWDSTKDPDCEPTYPPPPDGPSGRFDEAIDIAVDDWGSQYVVSRSGDGTEGRIDVFDSEGHFITELEDPLGPSSAAVDGEGNLYVYEKLIGVLGAPEPAIVRYPPTTYNPAAGEIAYDPDNRTKIVDAPGLSNGLAIDRAEPEDPTDDRLYVAEGNRIRIYSSAKTGNTLVDTITPAGLSSAKTIAVDAERRLVYVSTCKAPDKLSKCVVWVFKADAPYDFVAEIDGSQTPAGKFFSTEGRISIAVDEVNGHVFIGDLSARDDIFELDENYDFASTFEIPGGATGKELQSDVAENPKNPDPLDANPDDNYRYLYVPISGSSGSAIAFAPPLVFPPKIESVAAQNIGESEAELEALIDPGQRETTYAFEYVTEAQYEIDGFASATPAGSGLIPGLSSPQRVSALLSGLEPGESYRFLVTAENELGEADPKEGSFNTFNDAPINTLACANQALRIGLSAALPDCRAWELVTPPGARGPSGAGFQGPYFGALQASPDGNAMNFQINAGALPGTEAPGGFHGDPYLATRSDTGWSTELAGPTGTMASKPKPGSFSPDQGYSFWTAEGEGTALEGLAEPVYYVRYPDGRSEIVGRGSLGTDPRAQGKLITEGGTHIVFQTFSSPSLAQQLEPNAPEEGITAVYDRTADEVTHVVSLLPGEVTPTQSAFYVGASADGEGISFGIGTTLYLRVGNEVTYEIGTGVEFAGVSEGGERIFYLEAGDLKAFDTSSEEVIVFADTAAAVIPVNVAPQGNRAYFVSETATGGANPNGDTAQPGEPNLYLSEEGAITFVATVTERDVEGVKDGGTGASGDGLGLYTESLAKRQPAIAPSRLTPDGQVFVFQSRANLDGYDSGEDAQIYRYEAGERLHCVSCPPSKTAATGGASLQSLLSLTVGAPLSPYGFVPALRADGERLFFESTEALVSGDTDGLRDVYEWEENGVGSCNRAGGCVYLISSWGSSHPDYLFGHSASGDDVFVSTYDVLVGTGEETIRIYDARVGGGFAQPSPPICLNPEECRPASTPPPALPVPKSDVIGPPGNVVNPKPKPCPKGKRKVKRKNGKVVCVKKKKKHKAGANRRTAR